MSKKKMSKKKMSKKKRGKLVMTHPALPAENLNAGVGPLTGSIISVDKRLSTQMNVDSCCFEFAKKQQTESATHFEAVIIELEKRLTGIWDFWEYVFGLNGAYKDYKLDHNALRHEITIKEKLL